MLGTDLVETIGSDARGATRSELDITDTDAVVDAIEGVDVVVNAAAWTDVDGAETSERLAFEVNAIGAANVANGCRVHGARLVQISTDYVFPGDAHHPYLESAKVDPRNAYGRTKAAGEAAVLSALLPRFWIVRTAWLYGHHGESFLSKLFKLESDRTTLQVVNDQCGQPTWTRDLSEQIVRLVSANPPSGIFHGTSSGAATWYDFAQAAFEFIGFDKSRIKPVTSDRFPRPARRPEYSVLAHGAWQRNGIEEMRPWREALKDALGQGIGK